LRSETRGCYVTRIESVRRREEEQRDGRTITDVARRAGVSAATCRTCSAVPPVSRLEEPGAGSRRRSRKRSFRRMPGRDSLRSGRNGVIAMAFAMVNGAMNRCRMPYVGAAADPRRRTSVQADDAHRRRRRVHQGLGDRLKVDASADGSPAQRPAGALLGSIKCPAIMSALRDPPRICRALTSNGRWPVTVAPKHLLEARHRWRRVPGSVSCPFQRDIPYAVTPGKGR